MRCCPTSKRSLDGADHAFKFTKYAQRYLAETTWQFNCRFDLTRLVPSLLSATVRSTPWPGGPCAMSRYSLLKVRANQVHLFSVALTHQPLTTQGLGHLDCGRGCLGILCRGEMGSGSDEYAPLRTEWAMIDSIR